MTSSPRFGRAAFLALILCLTVTLSACSGAPMIDENDVPKITEKHSSLSLSREIGGRLAASQTAPHSVVYESLDGAELSTLSMYSDGKESNRFDSVSSGGEVRTYALAGTSYLCSRDTGAFICLKSVDTGAKQEQLPEIEALRYEDEVKAEEEAAAEQGFRAYKDGTFEVSGHTADCFGFEYPTYSERLCLSKEGIILYHKATGAEASPELKAIQYEPKVSPSAFELPEGAQIADMDAEYAGMGDQYAGEIAAAENAGACFDACEARNLEGDALVACYQTCSG